MNIKKVSEKQWIANMVNLITKGTNIEKKEIEDGFVLDVPVEWDPADKSIVKRRQFVFLTSGRKSPGGRDIVQVFTICAPEYVNFYKSALMLNMNLPFGAFAITEVEVSAEDLSRNLMILPSGSTPQSKKVKQNHFVIVDTYLIEEANYNQLKASILALAKAGDRLEKMLVGRDER